MSNRRRKFFKNQGGVTPIELYDSALFSLRKINPFYNGNCIKVRRDSDNATLDIGFVGTVLDSATLLSFCGSGNGYIEIWYNQSLQLDYYGTEYNAQQTTTTIQPQIVLNGVIMTNNGNYAIFFDGTKYLNSVNGALMCVNQDLTDGWAVFCVASVNSSSGTKNIWDLDNNIGAVDQSRVGQVFRVETLLLKGYRGTTVDSSGQNVVLNNQFLAKSLWSEDSILEVFLNLLNKNFIPF